MQGSFRRLLLWQRAKTLAVRVYALTREGELRSDWGMRDQMRRAAVSVASNIAEGGERGSDREAIRFLYIARGSIGELTTQLEIAVEAGLAREQAAKPLIDECAELARMTHALIASRAKSISCPLPLVPRSSDG